MDRPFALGALCSPGCAVFCRGPTKQAWHGRLVGRGGLLVSNFGTGGQGPNDRDRFDQRVILRVGVDLVAHHWKRQSPGMDQIYDSVVLPWARLFDQGAGSSALLLLRRARGGLADWQTARASSASSLGRISIHAPHFLVVGGSIFFQSEFQLVRPKLVTRIFGHSFRRKRQIGKLGTQFSARDRLFPAVRFAAPVRSFS